MADSAPERKRGFRGFVTRQETTFALVGAFIVFCGFYLREVYRDRAKDISDSLESARATFSIRNQIHQLTPLLELRDQDRKDDLVQRAVSGSTHESKIPFLSDFLQANLPIYRDELSAQRSALSMVAQLYEKLPTRNAPMDKEQEAISVELGANEQAELSAAAVWYSQLKAKDDSKKLSLLVDCGTALDSLRKNLEAAGTRLTAFGNSVITLSESQLQEAQAKVKNANRFSIALFVLGWILGLLGKILKLPALAGGAE